MKLRAFSWASVLLLACDPAKESGLDGELRWTKLSGVFEQVVAPKQECTCTRATAVDFAQSQWEVNCTGKAELDLLFIELLDSYPGPNRSWAADSFAAWFLPEANPDVARAGRALGAARFEYSNLVPNKRQPAFMPMRRLFIDFAALDVDPICLQAGGADCKRDSQMVGFEVWCTDTSLSEEP